MAKKGGFVRLILLLIAAVAAAAGLYFYLDQKDAEFDDDFDDDFDDFDDALDTDENPGKAGRKYVDLSHAASTDEKVEEDDFSKDSKDTEEFFNDEEGDE